MTTFNPLASVVLSIAIFSRFTLIPLSLSLWSSYSQQFSPGPPASRRNPAPKPVRRGDSLPRMSPRTPPANPSSPRCAPPPLHNLAGIAVRSTRRAAPAAQSFPAPGASEAEGLASLRGASCPPTSSASWPLPSTRVHARRRERQPRDKAASSNPQYARERHRECARSAGPCAPREHRPQSQKLFHREEGLPLH